MINYFVKICFYSLLLLSTVAGSSHAEDTRTLVIAGFDNNEYLSEISKRISTGLSNTGYKILKTDLTSAINHTRDADLFIIAGSDNIEHVLQINKPMLLITSSINTGYSSDQATQQARLHMTHSLCDQIKLIKLLNSHWSSTSIIIRKHNLDAVSKAPCLASSEFTVNTILFNNDKNVLNSINESLHKSDVLLALPDPVIYNSRTIKNILLTAYRKRVPVIGFSKNFVNAGALAGLHTTPHNIGQQAVDIINGFFSGNSSFDHEDYYPVSFDLSINRQVVQSLGLRVPSNNSIEAKLYKMTNR